MKASTIYISFMDVEHRMTNYEINRVIQSKKGEGRLMTKSNETHITSRYLFIHSYVTIISSIISRNARLSVLNSSKSVNRRFNATDKTQYAVIRTAINCGMLRRDG